jgi:hypothetical protein
MPVRVVGADRDQGHPRSGGGEEPGVGIGAAVVRHLEHVGPHVDVPVQDPGLGLGAEVAGEEDADAALGDPHEQAQVVRRRGDRGDLWRGRQHLDRRGADRPPVARDHGQPPGPGPAGERVDPADPRVGRGERAGGHLTHPPAAERPRQTGDVVGVEVGQEDQRDVSHPEALEAPVLDPDLGAGVHENGLARTGRHDEPVALPHVARHHVGEGRRPPADHLAHRPAHEQDTDQRGEREQPRPAEAPQQEGQREHGDRQQERAD